MGMRGSSLSPDKFLDCMGSYHHPVKKKIPSSLLVKANVPPPTENRRDHFSAFPINTGHSCDNPDYPWETHTTS